MPIAFVIRQVVAKVRPGPAHHLPTRFDHYVLPDDLLVAERRPAMRLRLLEELVKGAADRSAI
eukprot:CAMPEP_0185458804 /NCGR_PEP_ID=MMETSP1365-20130426/83317_1 /TAXON_ID=38817 /ORGANISM="Gephyrocapsa oceanica, Strain RCC1303" /LENGTH=62 /DNA_ID=CAMNT_0028065317 /DNA_START=12 /DNA_END=200 /DNA_ORIENTATION=+